MTNEIYFDNSATTRLCEAALDAYCLVSREHYGNPSSLHGRGLDAEKVLSSARAALLSALGVRDGQVVFTGSGSEANNLAVFGRVGAKARYAKKTVVTTAGEHASVSVPLLQVKEAGFTVREVPTACGEIDMAALDEALSPDTVLVTMMLVNNETGALYDLKEVSRKIKGRCPDAVLHVDATQAFLKVPFTPASLGADMISVSAHKVEGPKGVGALWVSDALIKNKGIRPLVFGGGQEKSLRAGTENVPAIAAFGAAIGEGHREMKERAAQMAALREALLGLLPSEVKPLLPKKAAPHILTLCLPKIKSEVMLHFLSARGIFVSSGSACSSHGRHGAHPLTAFGLTDGEADTCIRVSFSYKNTEEELGLFVRALKAGLQTLSRIK